MQQCASVGTGDEQVLHGGSQTCYHAYLQSYVILIPCPSRMHCHCFVNDSNNIYQIMEPCVCCVVCLHAWIFQRALRMEDIEVTIQDLPENVPGKVNKRRKVSTQEPNPFVRQISARPQSFREAVARLFQGPVESLRLYDEWEEQNKGGPIPVVGSASQLVHLNSIVTGAPHNM